MERRNNNQPYENKFSGLKGQPVTFGQIALFCVSVLLGIVFVLIVQNWLVDEQIQFSTLGLVGFLFSVALAGASITLAIAAIALGRSSEKAIIERSDESIRLQNEIFMRSTDALTRIESSTGVTEKRIEDIISGRAGDISSRIAESIGEENLFKGFGQEKIEEAIKKSMVDVLSESFISPSIEKEKKRSLEERKKRGKKIEKDRNQYRKFNDGMMIKLANLESVEAIKISRGNYSGDGHDLVDGVFRYNEKYLVSALLLLNLI